MKCAYDVSFGGLIVRKNLLSAYSHTHLPLHVNGTQTVI